MAAWLWGGAVGRTCSRGGRADSRAGRWGESPRLASKAVQSSLGEGAAIAFCNISHSENTQFQLCFDNQIRQYILFNSAANLQPLPAWRPLPCWLRGYI